MKIEVLGASGGVVRGRDSTAMLIDDAVLLDAGTGARRLRAAQIEKLRAILLTHAHMDHIAMIPFVADLKIGGGGIDVFGLSDTIDSLRRGMFNDEIWPNFENIKVEGIRLLRLRAARPGRPIAFPGMEFATPIEVEHAVPTAAYCLRGADSDFLFVSDFWRAPRKFWDFIRRRPRLRRMTIEVSFPDRMESLAAASMHLTPSLLAETLDRVPLEVEVFCTHMKPGCESEIRREVAAVARAKKRKIGFLKPGMVFEF